MNFFLRISRNFDRFSHSPYGFCVICTQFIEKYTITTQYWIILAQNLGKRRENMSIPKQQLWIIINGGLIKSEVDRKLCFDKRWSVCYPFCWWRRPSATASPSSCAPGTCCCCGVTGSLMLTPPTTTTNQPILSMVAPGRPRKPTTRLTSRRASLSPGSSPESLVRLHWSII